MNNIKIPNYTNHYINNGVDSLMIMYPWFKTCSGADCDKIINYVYLYIDKYDNLGILTICSKDCIMAYYEKYVHKVIDKYEDPTQAIKFLKKAVLLQ